MCPLDGVLLHKSTSTLLLYLSVFLPPSLLTTGSSVVQLSCSVTHNIAESDIELVFLSLLGLQMCAQFNRYFEMRYFMKQNT